MRTVLLVLAVGMVACAPTAPPEPCSVEEIGDGRATITCPDGSTATVGTRDAGPGGEGEGEEGEGEGEDDGSCGDGFAEAWEICDDGNTVAADGCTATCAVEAGWACSSTTCRAICGDGVVLGDETCDDEDVVDSGNGCSAACRFNNICGNGVVETEAEEECDDGDTIDVGNGCDGACHRNDICGDGVVSLFEICDDGASDDGDGCSSSCAPESGFACEGEPSVCAVECGDGRIVGGEACDDGNNVDNGNGCGTDCLRAGTCGDNVRQSLFETCDDGPGSACLDDCSGLAPCNGDPRPLCLLDCDPAQPLNGSQCRVEDGGPEDWSCAGFQGYVPADDCADAGQ